MVLPLLKEAMPIMGKCNTEGVRFYTLAPDTLGKHYGYRHLFNGKCPTSLKSITLEMTSIWQIIPHMVDGKWKEQGLALFFTPNYYSILPILADKPTIKM